MAALCQAAAAAAAAAALQLLTAAAVRVSEPQPLFASRAAT